MKAFSVFILFHCQLQLNRIRRCFLSSNIHWCMFISKVPVLSKPALDHTDKASCCPIILVIGAKCEWVKNWKDANEMSNDECFSFICCMSVQCGMFYFHKDPTHPLINTRIPCSWSSHGFCRTYFRIRNEDKTFLSHKKMNFKDFKAITSQTSIVQWTKVEQENWQWRETYSTGNWSLTLIYKTQALQE